MFKLRDLFSLSLTAGHQVLYSTQMLDFFYVGVRSTSNLEFTFFKLKEILFCLLTLKSFITRAVKKKIFTFLLIFSNLNQYLVVSELFDAILFTNPDLQKFLTSYFMLCPEVGFISSAAQRAFSFQEDVDLPRTIFFKQALAVSFGDAVLPIVVQEVAAKRGVVIGITDSNQVETWSHVDYIVPGNDDSLIVAYFFGLFILSIFSSIQFLSKQHKKNLRWYRLRRIHRRASSNKRVHITY